MSKWHETRKANVGLRLGGLTLLCIGSLIGCALYQQVHAHVPRQAGGEELVLCALLVASALVGNALLFLGPTLWKQIEVPGRHAFSIPDPVPMALSSESGLAPQLDHPAWSTDVSRGSMRASPTTVVPASHCGAESGWPPELRTGTRAPSQR